MNNTLNEAIKGCILGTAAGDSIGLPCEGISKRRQRKLYPELKGHNFLFSRGMVSDDTEHTIMVARAIMESGSDVENFTKNLAWKLRFWFLGMPAGIGMATLKASIKLWLGFSGNKSGVFSAGNGPAMRSAIIGVIYGNEPDIMKKMVRASTRITHTDPKAEAGALAVALAAHMAVKEATPDDYCNELEKLLGSEGNELIELIKKAKDIAEKNKTAEYFAESMGLNNGISGYIYNTVPVAIYTWFISQKDYREGITQIIRCGGDTDTTGAIVGAIIGAGGGKKSIPPEWLNNIIEWPGTVQWMEEVGENLAEFTVNKKPCKSKSLNPLYIILRNIFFTLIVLFHGLRRLLPPY